MNMSKRNIIKAGIATPLATAIAKSTALAQEAVKTGYAHINGLKYYYEITGKGEPLLVLHGGLGSIHMFGLVLPALEERRQIIAVDLHGHGRTQLGKRDISYVDQATQTYYLADRSNKAVDVVDARTGQFLTQILANFKGFTPCSPASCNGTMCGCRSWAAMRASRSKRSVASAVNKRSCRSTFRATSRSKRGS